MRFRERTRLFENEIERLRARTSKENCTLSLRVRVGLETHTRYWIINHYLTASFQLSITHLLADPVYGAQPHTITDYRRRGQLHAATPPYSVLRRVTHAARREAVRSELLLLRSLCRRCASPSSSAGRITAGDESCMQTIKIASRRCPKHFSHQARAQSRGQVARTLRRVRPG